MSTATDGAGEDDQQHPIDRNRWISGSGSSLEMRSVDYTPFTSRP